MAKVTFTTKGWLEVWYIGPQDVYVSRHRDETEATESATTYAASLPAGDHTFEFRYPRKVVKVFGVINPNQGGDVTAPTVPGNVVEVGHTATTATIAWDASTDNIGVAGYQVFKDGLPEATTEELSYPFTGLTPDTAYSFTVAAYDAAGNYSGESNAVLITTEPNAAPVWSAGTQELTTGDSYTLDLTTVCSDADGNPLTFSVVSGTLPTGITFNSVAKTVSGTPTTVQTQAVTFRASDGIVNTDQVITFEVLDADATAPSVPTLSASAVSSSQINLSWTASTDTGPANERSSGVASYKVYRSTDDVTYSLRTTVATTSYSDTGLTAETTYYYKVSAVDGASNESAQSSAARATTNAAWLTVPDFTFTEGTAGRQSFADYVPFGATSFTLTPTTPGITVDSDTKELVYDGVTAATTYTNRVLSSNTSQSEDWLDRINDPLVVWYHNFDSAAEVNAFRWTGNYGNDPNAIGRQDADLVRWVETGGADGGGYLEIYRPAYAAGTTRYVDGVHWWRPFSALTGASNGRGEDDPAADGTLPVGTLIATNGGSQTYNWTNSGNPNQGWYGHSSVQNSYFDGGDFWLQVRVMADPRRTTNPAVKVGKFSSFTTTRASYTTQELVTYSGYWSGATSSAYAGMPNVHNVYQGYGYQELASVSTGSPRNPSSASPWSYSFGWDTLLYHVSPGRQATNETVFQVWAARSGETSYTLIWDVVYPAYYSADATLQQGWNAFLCWIYQISDEDNQGYYNSSAFYQRYDQIVFKKGNGGSDPNTDGIRCPQV